MTGQKKISPIRWRAAQHIKTKRRILLTTQRAGAPALLMTGQIEHQKS
jgi:hypothetical protein